AELIEHGRDFDEAREHGEALVAQRGYRYVHAANEPELIAGVATGSLELFEDAPDLDAVYVAVGAGSGLCPPAIVRAALSPHTGVVGVQAEGAPAVTLSWRERRAVTTERAETIADGLATRVPFELTLAGILEGADDMVLVSDAAIAQAIRDLLRCT